MGRQIGYEPQNSQGIGAHKNHSKDKETTKEIRITYGQYHELLFLYQPIK